MNGVNEGKKSNKFVCGLLDWAEAFVFAIFVVILIFTFLFRSVVVVGKSMKPNFADKDRLVMTHLFVTPEKGDVLVMNSSGLNKTIIKRCIGAGGDTVRIDYNTQKITVNGEEISNDYINEPMIDKPQQSEDHLDPSCFAPEYEVSEGVYEYKVPDDAAFVMGDNRNNSTDSRFNSVGFVGVDDILGKVIFRIYPLGSIGRVESKF